MYFEKPLLLGALIVFVVTSISEIQIIRCKENTAMLLYFEQFMWQYFPILSVGLLRELARETKHENISKIFKASDRRRMDWVIMKLVLGDNSVMFQPHAIHIHSLLQRAITQSTKCVDNMSWNRNWLLFVVTLWHGRLINGLQRGSCLHQGDRYILFQRNLLIW